MKYLFVAIALVLVGCTASNVYTVKLSPTEGNSVSGTLTFTEGQVEGEITGLAPGKHGFHIHKVGDCSSGDGKSAGGHYNPESVDHGSPSSELRHIGDLGNILADENGRAKIDITDENIMLLGPDSIAGKGVIIHALEDDFGQPTGNAGSRVACGVIE